MAEIIEKDQRKLNALMDLASKTKDPNKYLEVAIKAKDLGDLYYEATEEINDKFIKYKEISGKYYYKVAKKSDFHQAYLMAALIYLQAGNEKKAKKSLHKFNRKGGDQLVDDIVSKIISQMIDGSFKHALKRFKKNKSSFDKNLLPEMKRMIKYQKKWNSST